MMIRDRLERIRERAYALWERAGGGHGDHESHWHKASAEIDGEDKAPKRGRRSAPKAPATEKPAVKRATKTPAKPTAPVAKGPHKAADPSTAQSSGAQSAKAKPAKASAEVVSKTPRSRKAPAKS